MGRVFLVARDTRLGYTRARRRIVNPAENLDVWEIGGESLPLRRRVSLTNEFRGGTNRSVYRRAVEGSERVLGPEHPNTVSYVGNMAGCRDILRRLEAAASR